jgi:hypothetical protein
MQPPDLTSQLNEQYRARPVFYGSRAYLEEVELDEFVGCERSSGSRIYNIPVTIMSKSSTWNEWEGQSRWLTRSVFTDVGHDIEEIKDVGPVPLPDRRYGIFEGLERQRTAVTGRKQELPISDGDLR